MKFENSDGTSDQTVEWEVSDGGPTGFDGAHCIE